jgi:exonuclease III
MPVHSRQADARCHTSYTSFYDYTYVTYNMNGLSAYHAGTPARLARYNRLLANIKALSLTANIIFLQETHLNHLDFISLNSILPSWQIFYSNKSSRSGGVATLISPLVHSSHIVTFAPIAAEVQGHALPLLLTPKEPHNPTILLHNLYLPTGKHQSDRMADVLDACCSVAPAQHNIAGGDMNFVGVAEDTSSKRPHALSQRARDSWAKFLLTFRLIEAVQPLHSFYRITDTLHHSRSARLDRLFHSMEEVDRQLYQPSSYIPHIPHSLLAAYTAIGEREELDSADIVLSMTAARIFCLMKLAMMKMMMMMMLCCLALFSNALAPPLITFLFVSPSLTLHPKQPTPTSLCPLGCSTNRVFCESFAAPGATTPP